MRYIILLLLAATVGLGVLASRQARTIKEQQVQLAAALDQRSSQSLAMQEQCARQAKLAFDATGFTDKDFANYQNHYNTKLEKCFVRLSSLVAVGKTTMDRINLFDAFENRDVGEYAWQSDPVKKYDEVPPFLCNVQSGKVEKRVCHSKEEFEDLAKMYMEG